MSLAIVYTRGTEGLQAPLVTVEVHLSRGLPKFSMVGLPEAGVKESKERVRSALLNSLFDFPMQRITVNLAPADLPKEGGRFDLAIAIGILAASKQISSALLSSYELLGELALSGELRPIVGAISAAVAVEKTERQLIISQHNAFEAAFCEQLTVYGARTLLEVCDHLNTRVSISSTAVSEFDSSVRDMHAMDDVVGQHFAKKALLVAAAGRHSLLMVGSPGAGKSMLASRLNSLLPPLTKAEWLEVAAIYSLSGALSLGYARPLRCPHHSASCAALVGGGTYPKPGEISLAHRGVLFLDELPEFNCKTLEALREPLENHQIHISRASQQCVFPAHFQFIAAMNPCPCGYLNDPQKHCYCTPMQINRYRQKISGPLLERIDIQLSVQPVPHAQLLNPESRCNTLTAERMQQQVLFATNRQMTRQKKFNADLGVEETQKHCELTANCKQLLLDVMQKQALSARIYHRILRLSRTLADLEDCAVINESHVSQALQFRALDLEKQEWQQPNFTCTH